VLRHRHRVVVPVSVPDGGSPETEDESPVTLTVT
jgi:hypothetical protein